ncbi:unnamed protein product [Gordionus sp. m RMFG-2023]
MIGLDLIITIQHSLECQNLVAPITPNANQASTTNQHSLEQNLVVSITSDPNQASTTNQHSLEQNLVVSITPDPNQASTTNQHSLEQNLVVSITPDPNQASTTNQHFLEQNLVVSITPDPNQASTTNQHFLELNLVVSITPDPNQASTTNQHSLEQNLVVSITPDPNQASTTNQHSLEQNLVVSITPDPNQVAPQTSVNAIFPRNIWTRYQVDGPRTNNHLEGYKDIGSLNIQLEDVNFPLHTDFIDPKSPIAHLCEDIFSHIELDDDIMIINKLENIPRYFFPTTKAWKKYAKIYALKPPKHCWDVDYGKQLGESTILGQIEGDGNCFYRAINGKSDTQIKNLGNCQTTHKKLYKPFTTLSKEKKAEWIINKLFYEDNFLKNFEKHKGYHGYVDLGDGTKSTKEDESCPEATKALFLMATFVKINPDILANLVIDALLNLNETGGICKAIVCDGCAVNKKMGDDIIKNDENIMKHMKKISLQDVASINMCYMQSWPIIY